MNYCPELRITHLHLAASKLGSLILLRSSFSLPSVALGRVISLLVRPLLLRANHLVLRVLRRSMLAPTIPMVDSHVHSILDICFCLLWKLGLVSNMLGVLEPSGSHAHDLRPVIVFLSLVVVASRVADSLQLRPVVNGIDFDGTWYHLRGVWSILSWLLGCDISCLLPALGIVTRGVHIFLYFSIVLVLWTKFVYLSLKLKFISFLCWNVVFITISGIRALLLYITNIQGWSLLDRTDRSSLTLSYSSTLTPLVSLWLALIKLLLHPCWLSPSI